MYLLDNVVFLAHPHTGSRSMKAAVVAAGGKKVRGHHAICKDTIARSRGCVGVVRNPFDITACVYFRPGDPLPEFKPWMDSYLGYRIDELAEPMFPGIELQTHVVRFEDYQESMNAATDDLGLPRLDIPWVGQNKRRKGRCFKPLFEDEQCRTMVERCYGDLLDELGYTLESPCSC
jgi:hypothetical protein